MASEISHNATLVAHCLCKAHEFKAEIPRSSLPLDATSCHCDSCRRVSGALYTSCALWPGDKHAIQESSLHTYAFSKVLTIHFCGTCSSPMFWQIQGDGSDNITYKVFTGVLKNIDVPNLVQFSHQMFLGDTRDGGASLWLHKPNESGVPAKLWVGQKEESQEIDEGWLFPGASPSVNAKTALDEVHFRCHCKGIDLILRNAAREYKGTDRSALPWFVAPTHKCIAGFDVCNSCRLQSGVDIFHWTFSFLRCVAFPQTPDALQRSFPETSSELQKAVSVQGKDRDPGFGTLTCYASSPDVQRYFCNRCGACVFYCVDDRPEIVDVAMGLLDAPCGARAEEFVSWTYDKKFSWRECVIGGWREGHINAVQSEVKTWQERE